jgi:multiple sugar transport system permease protein
MAAPFDLRRVLLILLVTGTVLVLMFPIIWMVFASIRPTAETLASPPVWWPRDVTLDAYRRLFADPEEIRYFVNSYVISLSTAALTLLLGAPAAYGFSRFRIKGATVILLAILGLQMMPNVSFILPFFTLARLVGVYNTYAGLVIANSAFTLPVAIWLLKGFFDSIPKDLEEAGMVDGCTRAKALWLIVIPLALPGLVSTAVFAFLFAWNEFLFAVVLTSGDSVAPLTIRMSQFFTQYGREWDGIMALNVIASLPLIVVFVIMQRWVVSGLTGGALK